jgi:hypothetical protein
MFGTLYVTRSTPEVISFGTAEQDAHRYLTLYGLIVTPFVDIARQLFPATRAQAVAPESTETSYS